MTVKRKECNRRLLLLVQKTLAVAAALKLTLNTSLPCRAMAAKSIFVFLILTLSACAEYPGGGGIGGTGKANAPDGLIVGVVDGFGSIIINNKRYETDAATIVVDGESAELRDLRVGMTIMARVDSHSDRAIQLRYQPDISGAVVSVSQDHSSLSVLGQTVLLGANTVLDELTRSEIAHGTRLEISGVRNAENELVATYIRKSVAAGSSYIVGLVEEGPLDLGVIIGDAIVDVTGMAQDAGVSVDEYLATSMEIGTTVRVEAVATGAAREVERDDAFSSVTVLTATGVAPVTRPPYNLGDKIQLYGVVGSSVDPRSFVVANVEVSFDDNTEVLTRFGLPMVFPDVPEDRLVLIDGVAASNDGVVVITRIQFLDQN